MLHGYACVSSPCYSCPAPVPARPERVAALRGFAGVSVGRSERFDGVTGLWGGQEKCRKRPPGGWGKSVISALILLPLKLSPPVYAFIWCIRACCSLSLTILLHEYRPMKRSGVAGKALRAAIISKYFPGTRKNVYIVALKFYSQLWINRKF